MARQWNWYKRCINILFESRFSPSDTQKCPFFVPKGFLSHCQTNPFGVSNEPFRTPKGFLSQIRSFRFMS